MITMICLVKCKYNAYLTNNQNYIYIVKYLVKNISDVGREWFRVESVRGECVSQDEESQIEVALRIQKLVSKLLEYVLLHFGTYQCEPGKDQVISLVEILKHEGQFADKRVPRAPDLTPVVKSIHTSKEGT